MHIDMQQLLPSLLWWSEEPPDGMWQWPLLSIICM